MFSIKYYLLTAKITPSSNNFRLLKILGINDISILFSRLYPDGIFVYITKDDFDSAQVILL